MMEVWDRASWRQKLAWRVEAGVLLTLFGFLGLLPIEAASALAGWVVRLVGPLTPVHKVALKNISLVFPDMDERTKRKLALACWDNVGRIAGEFPHLNELRPYDADGRVEVVGKQHLDAITKSGKPAVLISGHFANWEVMAAAICLGGLPARVSYRAANNPWIDDAITKVRLAYGIPDLSAKGGAGAKEMLEALREGQSVTFLNDQKFNQGLELPFFGHPAMTAPGPSKMAVRFGIPVLPVSIVRLPKAHFRVEFHEPIQPPDLDDKQEAAKQLVEAINGFLEARIRTHPESWFWVHRRWPKEMYKKG